MNMRTSYFCFVNDIDRVAAAGYDCAELHIKEIMGMDDAGYKAGMRKIRDSQIATEVFDNPLPLDVVIADEDFDIDYYTEYLKRAVDRTAALGAKYFVYGNGRTRCIPDGAGREEGRKKNDEMIAVMCGLAAQAGITILLEPLEKSISNRFLSVPEVYEYARQTGLDNLKTLVDYRWFVAAGHEFESLIPYAGFIKHVHIDNPLSPFPVRVTPAPDDGHDYSALFRLLNQISYDGIVSIEANTADDFAASLQTGLDFLKHSGISLLNGERGQGK